MQPNFRSTIFQRLFWCAFLAMALGVTAAGIVLDWPLHLRLTIELLAGAAVISVGVAFALSRPVDRRIARMRKFAEGLLEASDQPGSGSMLGRLGVDELEALDRSLLRMAGQTRVLVERAKVESARREAILASMAEGVLAVDQHLRVTFCNQALARLAGRFASSNVPSGTSSTTPSSGMPLIELVRDTTLHETLSEVIRTGTPAKRHLQIPTANGRSFELQAAPLISGNNPGDKPGAIAILHDITDLERLENVRKDFVANVSHEFRTPLAAISGYAETLLDGAIDDQENNRKFLEIIRSNAIRLNSIAADLLTLSELQASSQNTEHVPVGAAIESALSTIAAEAALRGVTLEKGPVDNLVVFGSRYRLEQALVNLLANAVKFNRPSGKVRVETKCNGSSLGILVSDTGMGIPSSDLPRIFERFYRVDKARSRQVGGTGLGLSIVKHIVERMDGHVSATSQLGKGSVFTITLPLT